MPDADRHRATFQHRHTQRRDAHSWARLLVRFNELDRGWASQQRQSSSIESSHKDPHADTVIITLTGHKKRAESHFLRLALFLFGLD